MNLTVMAFARWQTRLPLGSCPSQLLLNALKHSCLMVPTRHWAQTKMLVSFEFAYLFIYLSIYIYIYIGVYIYNIICIIYIYIFTCLFISVASPAIPAGVFTAASGMHAERFFQMDKTTSRDFLHTGTLAFGCRTIYASPAECST